MNKGSKIKMNIGTSSFVVIFVIVSLATFAVLSLVSANANKRMSDKAIQQIDDYYQMNNLAQEKLKQIDATLQENYRNTTNETDYFNAVYNDFAIASSAYSFTIEGTSQNLEVEIKINYPNSGDTFYDIINWSKQAKKEWDPKNNTDLLKMEVEYGN